MSALAGISKPEDRSLLITIFGEAGSGKTTLACTFTGPVIVIRAEDGAHAIPKAQRPDVFPILTSVDMLWDQLKGLLLEEHKYKTLVIDSVTSLERFFINDVMESDPKKPRGIQQALGGYGNGRDAVSVMHGRVRKAAGLLVDKLGMNVVFVAHADVNRLDLPDADSFNRYSLRLHDKSIAPYVDDVDLVGFLRLQTYIKGEEGAPKRAVSDGTRELITHASASCISKNRLGITDPLEVPFDAETKLVTNPLLPFITPPAVRVKADKKTTSTSK